MAMNCSCQVGLAPPHHVGQDPVSSSLQGSQGAAPTSRAMRYPRRSGTTGAASIEGWSPAAAARLTPSTVYGFESSAGAG